MLVLLIFLTFTATSATVAFDYGFAQIVACTGVPVEVTWQSNHNIQEVTSSSCASTDIGAEVIGFQSSGSVTFSSDELSADPGTTRYFKCDDHCGTSNARFEVSCPSTCTESWNPSDDGSNGVYYCTNGGTASGAPGSCVCTCASGFYGTNCELSTVFCPNNLLVQTGEIDGIEQTHNTGRAASISDDGSIIAVGAHLDDDAGNNAGHVRIFQWTGSIWQQMGTDIDGEAAEDNSGQSVRLSGDGQTVAIGAPKNNGDGTRNGHMRVFEWDGSDWVQKGLDIDGGSTISQGGYSDNNYFTDIGIYISSDGNFVAFKDISNMNFEVRMWTGSGWLKVRDSAGGGAMGKNGDIATVTVDPNDYWEFTVQVSTYSAGVWTQRGTDLSLTCAQNFVLLMEGIKSISLSGDGSTVSFACPGENIQIYKWDGSSWLQAGSPFTGEYTSFSSDGSRVAYSSSHILYLMEWDGSSWSTYQTITEETTHGNGLGLFVDTFELTSSGNSLIVGDHGNDEAYTNAGHVRVFSCPFFDECAVNPCQNGGTCAETSFYVSNDYVCTCAGGYEGTNCEIDANECAEN